MPDAVLIGGVNGAGKTTFARNLVPRAYPDAIFLNADEIQREGGDFASPLRAGRELLARLAQAEQRQQSFVLETTLSSSGYATRFAAWRRDGFRITLHYLRVVSADFAVSRVAERVAAGGHSVPEQDIRRRHGRSLRLFEQLYRPAVDLWYLYEVDETGAHLLADRDR